MSRNGARGLTRLAARIRPPAEDRSRFVEALALGALVGAAIAGSTLWTRIHEARRERAGARGEAPRPTP